MKTFLKALLIIIALTFSAPVFTYAQEPAVSLDEGMPAPMSKKTEPPPANAEEFAKLHFKKCLARNHKSLTDKEVENICSCSTAKMTDSMSFDEMKLMSKKTREGKDARKKFVSYAYAPCVNYLVADMTKNDCLASKLTENIKVGKMSVCKCAEKQFLSMIDNFAAEIMIAEFNKNSMNLDPMDEYLSGEGYFTQRDAYIERCVFNLAYARDNKNR